MESGRDHDRDARPSGANLLARVFRIGCDVDDLERLGGLELISKKPAFDRVILIDDRRRQIVHSLVDEAEQHELHDW